MKTEKNEIKEEIGLEESPEDGKIRYALDMCKKMYETPTFRAYVGIKAMLDRLARYMEVTPIEHGRDGNMNSMINAAAKYEQIRQSYKGAYTDMLQEQESSMRSNLYVPVEASLEDLAVIEIVCHTSDQMTKLFYVKAKVS